MKRTEYGCNICGSEDISKKFVGVSYDSGYVKLHDDLSEAEFHVCEDCEAKLLLLFSERRRASLPDSDARKTLTGAALILNERERQIMAPGYSPEIHDDLKQNELPRAAAYLATPKIMPRLREQIGWPLGEHALDFDDRISELVKAGALLAAEIDRLQRLKK